MRTFHPLVAILAAALASPAVAADQPKMQVRAEAIELILLRQKSVHDELNIGMEKAKKIFEFTFKQQKQAEEVHQLKEAQQDAKWEAMIRENEEFLHKSLNQDQRKRLKQIAMQTAGLLWISLPSAALELNLTDEQKQQAKKLLEEIHPKIATALAARTSESRNEKLAELRKASNEQLQKLFTAEQRQKWKGLIGKPFSGNLLYEEPEKGK